MTTSDQVKDAAPQPERKRRKSTLKSIEGKKRGKHGCKGTLVVASV